MARRTDRLFDDRTAAGRALVPLLEQWRGSDAVVCAIPRGGVPVAAEIARELGLPLDVVVVRKLGSAANAEYAVGAIADGARVVEEAAVRYAGMDAADLAAVEERERAELRRREEAFGLAAQDIAGRAVIVVDDGIATGSTAVAACRALRARGARHIVLAAPVAPEAFSPPADAVDDYVCVSPQREFWAVGQFYRDFTQTTDAEVIDLLRAATRRSG